MFDCICLRLDFDFRLEIDIQQPYPLSQQQELHWKNVLLPERNHRTAERVPFGSQMTIYVGVSLYFVSSSLVTSHFSYKTMSLASVES